MKHLILLIALLNISAFTYSQSTISDPIPEIPDLITDRPDQTESSSTVPKKSLQIESGFILENSDNTKDFAYNTTLLRYGLTETFEIRLGMDYLGTEDQNTNLSYSGLSPLYAGFKVMVSDEDGWKPEVAFLGGLIMPFTADDSFSPQYTAANIRFSLAHTLSEVLSLGYNIGVEWDGDSARPGYFYSIALGIEIIDNLGMYLESYGLVVEDNHSEHLFDAGFTYGISPNFQLDISRGLGINDNAIDNYVSFGLTYRIL